MVVTAAGVFVDVGNANILTGQLQLLLAVVTLWCPLPNNVGNVDILARVLCAMAVAVVSAIIMIVMAMVVMIGVVLITVIIVFFVMILFMLFVMIIVVMLVMSVVDGAVGVRS